MPTEDFVIWLVITCLIATTYGQYQSIRTEQCCEDYCFSQDRERPQTRHFASKTAYQLVKGSDYNNHYIVPDCTPTKIWLISRHGTRYPDKNQIPRMRELASVRDEIIKNYKQRGSKPDQGALCQDDLDKLRAWSWNQSITEDQSEYLSSQGWDDLKFLAKHYQSHFPEILENQYNSNKFAFRHTDTQRTQASFRAFAEGLFGEGAYNHIRIPTIPVNDTLLDAYDNCPDWLIQNDAKDGPNTEIDRFEKSELMNTTIKNISLRLGFKYPLEIKQTKTMLDMCRFEQAWNLQSDPAWCTAFTPSEIGVFEYAEDLKYYYKSGHGNELNSHVMCEAVQDMLKTLDSSQQPQSVSYFTHSSAIQMFLVALGIAKDYQPLRSDNFNEMKQRKWQISSLVPFAANFASVKYECPKDSVNPYKVIFFINQIPVELEWCKVGLCNWADVKSQYVKFLNTDCKRSFCGDSSATSITLSFILFATVKLLFISSLIKI